MVSCRLEEKVNLSIRKLVHGILVIILLLDFPLSRIVNLPASLIKYNNVYCKFVILMLAALAILLISYNNHIGHIIHEFSYLGCYVFLVVLLVSIIIFFSYENYNQSLWTTFVEGHFFYCVIISMLFIYDFFVNGNLEKDMRILNYLAFIYSFLCLLQSVLYANFEYIFFNEFNPEWVGFLNTNMVRVSLLGLPNFMFVYNFSKFISKKSDFFEKLNMILGIVCIIFVQQTRGFIIAIAICVIGMLLFQGYNLTKSICNILLIALLVVIIVNSSFFSDFISSFDSNSIKAGSSAAREYANEYYLDRFLENPLFANGFASSTKYSSIIHGSLGIAYYGDVGFMGLLAQTGVFAFMIFGVMIIRQIYVCIKLYKEKVLSSNIFVLGILLYCIGTSVSLIVISNIYVIIWAMCIAYVEYQYYLVKSKKVTESEECLSEGN